MRGILFLVVLAVQLSNVTGATKPTYLEVHERGLKKPVAVESKEMVEMSAVVPDVVSFINIDSKVEFLPSFHAAVLASQADKATIRMCVADIVIVGEKLGLRKESEAILSQKRANHVLDLELDEREEKHPPAMGLRLQDAAKTQALKSIVEQTEGEVEILKAAYNRIEKSIHDLKVILQYWPTDEDGPGDELTLKEKARRATEYLRAAEMYYEAKQAWDTYETIFIHLDDLLKQPSSSWFSWLGY